MFLVFFFRLFVCKLCFKYRRIPLFSQLASTQINCCVLSPKNLNQHIYMKLLLTCSGIVITAVKSRQSSATLSNGLTLNVVGFDESRIEWVTVSLHGILHLKWPQGSNTRVYSALNLNIL